jgi:outer membrane protein TolC
MKNILLFSLIVLLLLSSKETVAQEVKKLTFDEVIKLSEEQSPNALIAKHRFRSSYWQFRSYQAQFRPTLALRGSLPGYSNGFDKVYDSNTDQYTYVPKNTISSSGTLSLTQAVGFSGTSISLQSAINHLYDFGGTALFPRQ